MMKIMKSTSSISLQQFVAYCTAFVTFLFAFSVILFGEQLNREFSLSRTDSSQQAMMMYEMNAPDYDQLYFTY